MRWLNSWKDAYWTRRLRAYGCKVAGGISRLGSSTELLIEPNVSLGYLEFECANLKIGTHTYIRSGSELHRVASIGRYCSIANGVQLGLPRQQHPTDWLSTSLYREDVYTKYQGISRVKELEIGHDCWIGRDACILDGVKVANGAIVAAHAVVTSDVPPYAIVAGTPARVVRYRFNESLIERLEQLRWWELSETQLRELDFSDPLAAIESLEKHVGQSPIKLTSLRVTQNKVTELAFAGYR